MLLGPGPGEPLGFTDAPAADDSSSFNPVDLDSLKQLNRSPHTSSSGLTFPTQLLDSIRDTDSGPTGQDGNAYIVVEENTHAERRFSIVSVTRDLTLANELAAKHFRDGCCQYCPDIAAAESPWRWVNFDRESAQPGLLNWGMNEHACVRLYVSVPEAEALFGVFVEPQVISRRL